MRARLVAAVLAVALAYGTAGAGSLQHDKLQAAMTQFSRGFDGRVGACVMDSAGASCVRGDERFSLQSVVKMLVAMAVLERVDGGELRLNDTILVRREDLSLSVQPLAEKVGPQGYRASLDELVRLAIEDSDSAACDILMAKLGGPAGVDAFLERKGIVGMRVDRDERHLQTEIVGLTWQPAYLDPAVLEKATAAVPAAQRTAAYRSYQADVRDTATPKAMASLLYRLATGKLLSSESTRYLLEVMTQTATGPDRLKAGTPAGWTLAHKTGTSGSWQRVTAATNDVGVLRTPDGAVIVVAVFVGDSRASDERRAKVIARVAEATAADYH